MSSNIKSEIHDEINEFNEKIYEEQQKSKEYNKILNQSNNLQEEISLKINQFDQIGIQIKTHRDGLINDISTTHSKDDLIRMLRGFDRQIQGDIKELDVAKARVAKIQQRIELGKEKKLI